MAKLLSREKQDIILMDDNEERLTSLSSNFDLMTVVASPTSIKGLKEVGAGEADLFIAVTPDESRNMTACMLATNLGAEKTVARIDNYEYLLPKHKEFFKKLGVDSLIYPEMLAAKEIVSAVRMSWVRQWWEFCGGALVLIGTKMREKAEILNIPLHELGGPEMPYHIVAIKRGSETKIPRGDDTIRLHDIVYFTTTRKYIPYIRKIAGKEEYADIRNVMIMGGSRIAMRFANLAVDKFKIKVIEIDRQRCDKVAEKCENVRVVYGDARDIDTLRDQGIQDFDAFVALTDSSEANILTCLSAKELGVEKTIAEVEDIQFISQAENLNIGTIINKKLIASSKIFQILLDADTDTAKCLALADAEVAELEVHKGAKVVGTPVYKLKLPRDITFAGMIRDGRGMLISGQTELQPGDHVLVFTLGGAIHKLDKLFY